MRWHLVLSRVTGEKYKELFPGLYSRMPCAAFCLLWGGFCFFWTHRTTSAFGLSIPFSLLCYHYPHCWFITTRVDTIELSFIYEFLSSYSSFCSFSESHLSISDTVNSPKHFPATASVSRVTRAPKIVWKKQGFTFVDIVPFIYCASTQC